MEITSQPADAKAMAMNINLIAFTDAGSRTVMFVYKKMVVSRTDEWNSG